MGWRGILGGVSWVLSIPAVVIAASNSDIAVLALGALGPPATSTLTNWLVVGGTVATISAVSTRKPKMIGLAAATFLSLGAVAYRGCDVSTHDVAFRSSDITIAATIYEPRTEGLHPAAVIVQGSAPLRRGFYSLWAERLARTGVVVIVPDKRGVGGSGGTLERNNNSSRTNLELLASDVVAALDFSAHLPTVDTASLGLFGLSQAGWVAPMAAIKSSRARFLLFVTAPTVSVREEGAWSRMRGDDESEAKYSREAAERIIDTVSVGGVDARARLGALSIPGLWVFGADDNSIPTRKSVAVLDSLRGLGKSFEAITFPDAGHLLFTRKGMWIPRITPSSWDTIDRWISQTSRRHGQRNAK